ncbi:MAG: hypothetical protein L6R42_002771 [Xanthoria sp. 1 TBL-2021]|nr:MAG: hypothetical protein L6R42_002771 [Xanthoria sp. 1 TBL-2021]
MATHLPRPQAPQQPFPLTPNSPPKHFLHNVAQHQRANDPIAQQPVTESRPNGTPAHGNTNLLVPKGPHALTTNGDASRRATMPMNGIPFNTARSPPNAKNTSHVPCKFFRLGQCQAGKACPFSHSTDVASVDTPCKYFAKGNCKFGAKCALAHILPNGRRVNRPNNVNGGPLNLGGRVDPQTYHPDSALASSLLAQQTNGDSPSFGLQFTHAPGSEYIPRPHLAANGHDSTISTEIFATNPEFRYGSPRDDGRAPLSPGGHLSTLDAPMPASFDSQGISYIARHGPVAASVPSKFGLESPSSSLPEKAGLPSSTLRNLHNSAFGGDPRSSSSNLGSSPLGSGDEAYGRRIMHSELVTRPTAISASVPRARMGDDWDEEIIFGGEEDFLPTSLHDLLTPQERMQRLSRTEQDERPSRDSLSGPGTPADSSSHVGSPSHASPSRFSAFFAKQRRDEQNSQNPSASVFGHVGSPLRNSSMPVDRSPSLRATSNPVRSGDVSPYLSSPPRQSSMSMISQQLARTQLSSKADSGFIDSSSSAGLHPNSARTQNQTSSSTARLDRVTSPSSINNERIEEEQGDGVFSMEEEEDIHRKRHGENAWNLEPNSEKQHDRPPSPRLGPIGTGRNLRAREIEQVSKEYWT